MTATSVLFESSTALRDTSGAGVSVAFGSVVKTYGPVHALDDVSFRIASGQTVALLGPNGAGKSTAIGCMLGLRQPDRGTVEVLGAGPGRAVGSGRIGAMLQESGLPAGVTVAELVDCVRSFYPRPFALRELLARVGVDAFRNRRVEQLSGGQQQRTRFALAIAGDPELVFLDEPTVGMDVETRRAFWDQMRSFAAEGRTVLFATHYLDEADAVADRVIVLNGGRVAADGPASAIKAAVGARTVRFTLPDARGSATTLEALPAVADVSVHGDDVRLTTRDADATVRALYATSLPIHDLEVTGAGLEDAFLALTKETER